MRNEWKDGFGTWTAIPEPEIADDQQLTFADECTVIGHSGPISASADVDEVEVRVEWRDGFGDWVSS